MKKYSDYGLVNVGTGKDQTIKELAYLIKSIVGFQGKIEWDSSKPDGTPRKLLDVSKIRDTDWKHKISLENGLKDYYDWYLNNSW